MKLRSFFALLLAASAALGEPVPVGGPIEVNGIAAKVNGRVITKSKVSVMLAPAYAQLAAQFPRRGPEFEKRLKEARDKVLDQLIDNEIILDEFKVMGASLKTQYIDDDIAKLVREKYNGKKELFNEDLRKNRLTMDGFREITRERLTVQAMRAQHFSEAPPPLPNEIQKEYNELKASFRDVTKDVITFQMIFIPMADPEHPESTPDTQLNIAEDVMSKVQAGQDFAELAKTYSKDAFAATGGTRENVPRTDLSPAFSAILFEIEPGKATGPLQDPQGFSIVKVIKKELGPSEPLSNPKVRDLIEEAVRRKKTEGEYKRWIESKRKRAIIDRKI
ncbi:SurA N-terminal domain-containing protein [Luteolibacter ambystomatis]|uniref:peptidylprolyl isomerase n=1 Tax=Luteolibacter ambystomatis TaxID=2824561 RepID=A0A975J2P4_9BACT|nr:peptidylprolyl isomerase [Luteolibacter ambystomatis]QUE52948.1 SurA N-terminal domain-containing protein [Luteolibacter ambystomatis]